MAGEILGNLTVGSLLMLLAIPLVLLHTALLWMVVRVLRGGNPLSEVFGRGRLAMDSSVTVAVILFVIWFVVYLIWDRKREERSKGSSKKEEDPTALDISLVIVQILFAAPSVVMAVFSFYGNIPTWVKMNVVDCSAVIAKLLGSPHRVALEVLQRELPEVDWENALKQLKLIPGVVFLSSAPAGLSLTGELRKTFVKQRWESDWRPPPREERFEFVCMRCGQKLRLRRFQVNHTIRCPKCEARYRGRMDLQGRLRIEPEPERKRERPKREETGNLAGYYKTLELPRNADLQMLRRAYRKMMKQYHPDLYATAEPAKRALVEEKAKQINEAYHALMDHLEGNGI